MRYTKLCSPGPVGKKLQKFSLDRKSDHCRVQMIRTVTQFSSRSVVHPPACYRHTALMNESVFDGLQPVETITWQSFRLDHPLGY